jgi:fucose permease
MSRVTKWITVSFGLLFVAIAAAIFVTADRPLRFSVYAAALVIGGLGLDALLSALRNKPALLLRIGGFP